MNDEEMAEAPLNEVPRQVADLERACAHLDESIGELVRRCASVISAIPKSDQGTAETPPPALCPLAASLRTCVECIETAREEIDSLRARMEL